MVRIRRRSLAIATPLNLHNKKKRRKIDYIHNYTYLLRYLKDIIQGVIESCTDILTTSYWLHVELGKNI
jgi:hypothetical protein